MYLAGFIVASFLVAGVYAAAWLRGRRDHYHRAGLIVPLAVAGARRARSARRRRLGSADASPRTQPTKLAAIEGLEQTTKGAGLTIGGVYFDGEVHGGISIPDLLSLLAFHDPDATVQGLDAVPADDRPPVGFVRNSFQVMVGIGTLLAALGALVPVVSLAPGRAAASHWFYRAVVARRPAALIALIAGWIVTEVGRQPWIVYGLMRTEEAVTGAEGIPVGYATLVVVYVGLARRRLVHAAAPRQAGTRA